MKNHQRFELKRVGLYMLKIGCVKYELSLISPGGITVSTSGARDAAVKVT